MNPSSSVNARFYVPGQYRPEQGVGFLMRGVLSSVRAQTNARMAAHDLTYVQWLPLYKLVRQPNCTVASLSRELDMDPGAMTRALDRLEAKGLARRERSTTDRRVVHLVATPAGREQAKRVQDAVADVLNAHLKGFTHEEWQLLVRLLERMLLNGEGLRQEAHE